MAEDGRASRYQAFCADVYPLGDGVGNPCAMNVAMSFLKAQELLVENFSSDQRKWRWVDHLVIEYQNPFWSNTALKPFWHRTRGASGNSNTPGVAKISDVKNVDSVVIACGNKAGVKYGGQLSRESDKGVNLFGVDPGHYENPLQGWYFDF